MVFPFNPKSLIQDEEKRNKDAETEGLKEQSYDEYVAEQNKILEKKKDYKKSFDKVDQAIRETDYAMEHGIDKWFEAKKKQDPDFELPKPFWQRDDKNADTLEKRYGEKETIQVDNNKVIMAGSSSMDVREEDGKEIVEWKDKDGISDDPFDNPVSVTSSIGFALVSGGIKIPYGFANLGAMIMDLAAKDNIPVDQSKVARLENWFDKTYVGNLMGYSEAKARQHALGRITEAIVQIYGGWKTVGKYGVKATDEAMRMLNKATDAIKNGKYVRTTNNKNLYQTAKNVEKLNKLSGKQKFVGVAVGGGVSGAVVYDTEDIGTFGDIFFDPGELTALDRKQRGTSKADATRMLYNKLKFSGEMGFPVIPSVIGLYKVGNRIFNQGKNLAYSNSAFDKAIEKFVAKPLRARRQFPEEEFQQMQRLEGKGASARKLTEDYLKDFDQILKQISKVTQPASNASGLTDEISKVITKALQQGQFIAQKGKILPRGYTRETSERLFKALTKDLKVPQKNALELMNSMTKVQESWATFLNTIFKGGNVNVGVKKFADLMNDRIQNVLSSEYKIFRDPAVGVIDQYAPAASVKKQVRDIFIKNAAENDTIISKETADMIVNSIIKNAKLDKTTGTPIFTFPAQGALKDRQMITKNIAENITGGGKFKADPKGGLIRAEKDLTAFKKLFGKYENADNIMANVTADFANIAARDTFYNNMKTLSKGMERQGMRGMVYDSWPKASKALPNQEIVPLTNLPNKLGEEVYSNPLATMWTSADIKAGLKEGIQNNLGSITKNVIYQYAVMLPKGLVQAGKTILGPFTHARNFSSGAVTTVALGNIAIPPQEIYKMFRTAMRTIQPQFFGRNRPGLQVDRRGLGAKAFTEEGGQSLYRFLLEEGMVNVNVRGREVIGIFEDIGNQKGIQMIYKRMNGKLKRFLKGAQDAYIAEDDYWKIWNFGAEAYKLRRAYGNALKAGKIKKSDIPGGNVDSVELLKQATKNVREMLPNYAYVSEFVQATRRSPLGNFVGWPSEIIRTSYNIMDLSTKEMANPVLKRIGIERATGFALATAAMGSTSVWAFKKAYGFTTEKLNALKEFLPWFSADSTVLPIYEDGKYKYVDFSRGYFYDTITQPIQAVVNSMEENKDKPVIPGLAEGLVRALGRLVEPFVSESIWVGGILDLAARGGVTRKGVRVFNPRDDFGRKIQLSIQHLAKTYSPGSRIQVERLYNAVMGKKMKGVQYEIPDELLGLVGGRPAPLDIKRTLNMQITEHLLVAERDERALLFEDLRTGDPVDPNQVITQFIYANEKRYESWSELKRKIDAAMVLGFSEDELSEIFVPRIGQSKWNKLLDNEFTPFSITQNTKENFERFAEEKGIANPFENDFLMDKLEAIEDGMTDRFLNQEFIFKDEDYFFKPMKKSAVPMEGAPRQTSQTPLPQTPQPKITTVLPQKSPITGLTRTETALLSPSEQEIARKT
jgi:hypothetical protein